MKRTRGVLISGIISIATPLFLTAKAQVIDTNQIQQGCLKAGYDECISNTQDDITYLLTSELHDELLNLTYKIVKTYN